MKKTDTAKTNENTEKTVSVKQLVAVIFLLGMSVNMFMLPVLMLKHGGRDSYITMGICLLGELVCLMILLFSHRLCPQKTFFELLRGCLGTIISKVFTAVIMLYFFFKLILIMCEVKIFFTVSVYENLPWPLYIVPFLALLCAFGIKSLRGAARTAEIFTPLIALSAVIICLFLVGNVDFENLLPIFENGAGRAAEGIYRFPLWFGDFSVLIIFLGHINKGRHAFGAGMLSGAAAAAAVLLFSVMIFASYADVHKLLQYGQNISSLTQLSTAGFNFGRFDIIIFSVWMISVFIMAALMFSAVVRCAEYVFGVDRPFIFSVSLAVLLYITNIFVMPNESAFHALATGVLCVPALVMQYAVPLLILLCALRCRRKGRALYEK